MLFKVPERNKICSRKSSLSNRSMTHCIGVCVTLRQDFTTLDSFRGGNCFIFNCDDCVVNNRNMVFMLQMSLPRMCTSMHLIGQCSIFSDELSQVQLFRWSPRR